MVQCAKGCSQLVTGILSLVELFWSGLSFGSSPSVCNESFSVCDAVWTLTPECTHVCVCVESPSTVPTPSTENTALYEFPFTICVQGDTIILLCILLWIIYSFISIWWGIFFVFLLFWKDYTRDAAAIISLKHDTCCHVKLAVCSSVSCHWSLNPCVTLLYNSVWFSF